MSEDEKKDKLNEQVKHKDNSNLVVDEKKQVKDIYDIIEEYKSSSKTSTIGKINKLTEYGGSIEQVVDKYNEISGGNVSNIDKALEYLEQAYRIVAQIISEAPNGYVINLETGNLNEEKSKEQRIKYGIDEGEYVAEENDTDKSLLFETMQEETEKTYDNIVTVMYEKNFEDPFSDLYDSANDNDFINEAFGEDNFEVELPEDIMEEYNEAEENILSKDAVEMGFAILFNESQKHPERSKKELDNFMKRYPEYQEKFLEIVKNGIDINELELYKNSLIKKSFSNIMSKINRSTENELFNLPEETKKGILTRALSIMDVGMTSEYLDEILSSVQKLYPQITSLDDFETIGEILGIPKDEVMNLGLQSKDQFAIIDIARMIEIQKDGKITNQEMKSYFLKNNEQLKIDDINKTPMQIYFKNSKIEFSEASERSVRRLSSTCKVASWIDNKDKVVEYEFLSLISEKERLEELLDKDDTDRTREQLKETEEELEEFENNHIDFEKEKYFKDGKLKKEYFDEIKLFKKAKVKGDILSNYIEDAEKIKDLDDYNKLSKKAKMKYFRDTLFGLADNNTLNKKIALRRMEIISSKDNPLITYDENNNSNLDMELFMQKCIEYDVVSRENSDILYNKDTYFREMSKYTIGKLKSYESLPDKYFVKLDDVAIGSRIQQAEAKSRQIDEIKFKNKYDREQEIISKTEQNKIKESRTSGRNMTQDEIDELIKMMKEQKEESVEEKFQTAFSKNGKDFDNAMYELIYENPMAAQEFLKQSLENDEISSTSNFQTKIMFLQSSIKQVEKEKLKSAFNKDEKSFKEDVEEMVTLSPAVAQEFLKEFVSDPENASINKFNEKVMMLQERINQTLDERGTTSKEKSSPFLTAEEVDISNLPKEVGVSLITDVQDPKSQEDDEPSL